MYGVTSGYNGIEDIDNFEQSSDFEHIQDIQHTQDIQDMEDSEAKNKCRGLLDMGVRCYPYTPEI